MIALVSARRIAARSADLIRQMHLPARLERELRSRGNSSREREAPSGEKRRFYAMTHAERFIWGATAGVLRAIPRPTARQAGRPTVQPLHERRDVARRVRDHATLENVRSRSIDDPGGTRARAYVGARNEALASCHESP